jgi:hypothetical protein
VPPAAGEFYNTSDRQQVSATGAPYAFFHRPLQGYPAGFPVLLPNALPSGRAAALLQYLLDGSYLDGTTRGLTAELLAFNADLSVFGYARAEFQWQAGGAITGRLSFQGLPAMQYGAGAAGGALLFARELLPVWALALAFAAFLALQTRAQLGRYRGERSQVQVRGGGGGRGPHWLAAGGQAAARPRPAAAPRLRRPSPAGPPAAAAQPGRRLRRAVPPQVFLESGTLVLDALLALLLLLAAALWTAYVAHGTSAGLDPQPGYAAYDAPSFSRARWLLPRKLPPALASPAAAADPALRERLARLRLEFGPSLDEPGGAGRWGLQDADGEFDGLASLMARTHELSGLYVCYGLVQALGLVLLVFRLMRVGRAAARPAPAAGLGVLR